MAREWRSKCKICEEDIGYSAIAQLELHRRGLPRPQLTPEVERELNREVRAMAVPAVDLLDGKYGFAPREVQGGSLGAFPVFQPLHELVEWESSVDPSKFGITEESLRNMYQHFQDPKVQVLVAVGPTGSGKSTYLPYSLLVPPKGIQQDFFTRHGQIVITQPRIQATRNLPAFVGKVMHGCTLGAGFDVGFRHSGAPMSDWRSKLVYVTDGTLINWIAAGELDKISLIMIDEAHERSLNIDIIIGLLSKVLPRYPHLRLIIASATIDQGLFVGHFNRHLKGRSECRLVTFAGKSYRVTPHFRPENQALEYDPENVNAFAKRASVLLAEQIFELLLRMLPGGEFAKDKRGDILGFLHGERPIQDAVALLNEKVADNPKLKDIVKVLPLYTTLPQKQQDLALQLPTDESRIRVIISTNVAETSLTIHGIKHVVETGLINQSIWNSETQTKQVRPLFHSQAGCQQRWGRAGRLQAGDAWCLYTEKQFNDDKIFPKYSQAEIERSPLEQVVLTAKLAGVDRLEPEYFPWIQAPPENELRRAMSSLQIKRALDEDGDLTAHGHELQKFGGDVAMAALMTTADRFACAIEMATVIPMMKVGGHKRLLRFDQSWPVTLQRNVRQIHNSLIGGCRDDLEMCLKIYSAWKRAEKCSAAVTGSWAWPTVWRNRLPPLPQAARTSLGENNSQELVNRLQAATSWQDIQRACRYFDRDQLLLSGWLNNKVRTEFARAGRESWSQFHFVDDSVLQPVHRDRESQITALSVRKKEQERRPINFELLDRLRLVLAWCLQENCFVRSKNESKGPVYQAVKPSHPQDENAASEPTYVVEIGYDSVCHGKSLPGFLCGDRRLMSRVPYAGADAEDLLVASFIVQVDPAWLERLGKMSLMELTRFISEQTETRGQQGKQSQTHFRRLFIDQLYPLHAQIQYGETQGGSDTVSVTQLVRLPIALAGGQCQPQKNLRLSPADSEADELFDDADELDAIEDTNKLSQRIQIAGVKLVQATETNDDVQDDEASDEELAVSIPEHPESVGPFQGRLVLAGKARKTPTRTADVRGFDWSGNEPILILSTPTSDESFREFQSRFKAGDHVKVNVIAHEGFPGDRRIGLRVHEETTGLETIMEPEQISFSLSGHASEAIPVGANFLTVVEAIDAAAMSVQLTTLPLAEDLLKQLEDAAGAKIVEGKVCDVSERKLFLHLAQSRPDRGIILTASIKTDADRKQPTTYDRGYRLKLALQFKKTTKQTLKAAPKNTKSIRNILSQYKVEWDLPNNELLFNGRMPYATRSQLLAAISDPVVSVGIERLFRNSNTPLVEVADLNLAQKYPVGKPVQISVEYVDKDWARGRLPDGANAKLQRSGFPVGKELIAGTTVTANVIHCDVNRQEVIVSTRRIYTTSLAVHNSSKGKVIGSKGSRIREIENVAGVEIEVDDNIPRVRIYGPDEKAIHAARRMIRETVPRTCWGEVKIPASEIGRLIGSGGSNVNRIRSVSNVDIDSEKDGRIIVHASTHRELEGVLRAIAANHSGNALKYEWTAVEPVQKWVPGQCTTPMARKVIPHAAASQHNLILELILAVARFFARFSDGPQSPSVVLAFAGEAWFDEAQWYGDKARLPAANTDDSKDVWNAIDDGIQGLGLVLIGLAIGIVALFVLLSAIVIFKSSATMGDVMMVAFGHWKLIVGYAVVSFVTAIVGGVGLRQAIVGAVMGISGLVAAGFALYTLGNWLFGDQSFLTQGIIGSLVLAAIFGLAGYLLSIIPERLKGRPSGPGLGSFYPISYRSSSNYRYSSYNDDDEEEDEDEEEDYDDYDDEDDSYFDDEVKAGKPSVKKVSESLSRKKTGPFPCSHCTMSFTSKRGLEDHVKAKHKPFPCPRCSKEFGTEQGRDAHVKAKHP